MGFKAASKPPNADSILLKIMQYENNEKQGVPMIKDAVDRILNRPKKYKTEMVSADEAGLARAAALLTSGENVAIPTETVYGLAASAFDETAARRIFEIKGRPGDNPLIVHVSSLSMIWPLVEKMDERVSLLAKHFWPGPLTLVMKKSALISDVISAGLDTVAIRIPAHPATLRLIELCKFPIAAPSANPSGRPSPTTAFHVYEDLNGRIPMIVDGGSCTVGVESTVLSLVGEATILRPGRITEAALSRVIGPVSLAKGVMEEPQKGEKVASPGMAHRHYAPNAKVVLLEGNHAAYLRYIAEHPQEDSYALCFNEDIEGLKIPYLSLGDIKDPEEAERRLFSLLRELDELGAKFVYAHIPDHTGRWLALFNRLQRAAGFEVIRLEREK